MSTYQENGRKINKRLSGPLSRLNESDRREVINAILFLGQTAKFRCRNNKAYDTFCGICFSGIAKLDRTDSGLGFDILQVSFLTDWDIENKDGQ